MADSNTTKKIISNQAYESIQPYTLKDEPVAKSTILFANRYSGVNEVSVTDESLKEAIYMIKNRPRKRLGYKTPLEVLSKFFE